MASERWTANQSMSRGVGSSVGHVTLTFGHSSSVGVYTLSGLGPPLFPNRGMQLPGNGANPPALYLFEGVGMVKPSQSENTAFTLTSEDFPALPGTTPPSTANNSVDAGNGGRGVPESSQPYDQSDPGQPLQENPPARRGITFSPDGKVSNIPASMVNDQFGMVGLLSFMGVAKTDPNLVSLALGCDLTALGLNLNATDSLYPGFSGPWGEGPVRAEDIDYPVPQEYNISEQVRRGPEFISISEKLASLKMNLYKDELLFYLFYTCTGDVLQILAAAELYNRDWRYHKEEKIWICRAPGVQALEKGQNFERGTYHFFDPKSWRKVAKELYLEYEKLEERPVVPPSFLTNFVGGP